MADWFDAQLVRRWAQAGVEQLRLHRTELNALNVFPIPDGDTGTNLYLTFRAAAEAEAVRTGAETDLADALSAMARGALLGARGNSGVILAQTLQSFAELARSEPEISLAKFLTVGAKAARSAVANPVEGTALTVLDAAASTSAQEPDSAAIAARAALLQTPTMLESLAKAGVVDAGGRGVVILLDALNAVWHGTTIDSPPVGRVPELTDLPICQPDAKYELMFLLNRDISASEKHRLAELGLSIAISETGAQSQVHIHTDNPDQVIATFPELQELKIENLQVSSDRRVIVQSAGAGMMRIFADLGVLTVPGEAGNRASVQDFVTAGIRANAKEVLLLPSDVDSYQVAELAAKELTENGIVAQVLPTDSVVQTLAAVSVYDQAKDLAEVLRNMSAAAAAVSTVSVSVVERSAETEIGNVVVGDYISFRDGQVVGSSPDLIDVVCATLTNVSEPELITVVTGATLTAEDAQDCQSALTEMFPNVQLNMLSGGQLGTVLTIGFE